jgi:hypothetical protein
MGQGMLEMVGQVRWGKVAQAGEPPAGEGEEDTVLLLSYCQHPGHKIVVQQHHHLICRPSNCAAVASAVIKAVCATVAAVIATFGFALHATQPPAQFASKLKTFFAAIEATVCSTEFSAIKVANYTTVFAAKYITVGFALNSTQ